MFFLFNVITKSVLTIFTYCSYLFLNEREREMFYLTTHSTHFIYGYMASDIWLRTILIVRKETRCRHIGYSYRLTARVLLYAPSHRQDSTYHGLCYTSRGALAGTRNSSMGCFWMKQLVQNNIFWKRKLGALWKHCGSTVWKQEQNKFILHYGSICTLTYSLTLRFAFSLD